MPDQTHQTAPEATNDDSEPALRVPVRSGGSYVVCLLCANKQADRECVHCNGTGLRRLPDFPMIR